MVGVIHFPCLLCSCVSGSGKKHNKTHTHTHLQGQPSKLNPFVLFSVLILSYHRLKITGTLVLFVRTQSFKVVCAKDELSAQCAT